VAATWRSAKDVTCAVILALIYYCAVFQTSLIQVHRFLHRSASEYLVERGLKFFPENFVSDPLCGKSYPQSGEDRAAMDVMG
jgi:hypothetical protein